MGEVDNREDIDLNADTLMQSQQRYADGYPSFFQKYKRIIVVSAAVLVVLVVVVYTYFSLNASQSQSPGLLDPLNPTQLQDSEGTPLSSSSEKKTASRKRKKVKYEKLFMLDAVDMTQIVKELSFANIIFKTEQNGSKMTVFVDSDEIETARNLLAIKGLPGSGAKGYALLDNAQTLGVTEFDKRIRFLRALSGELEKAINQFEMIEDSKVQIVLPEHRLFSPTQPLVTSSILIRKSNGSVISDEVVYSIIQLVANAVENLDPNNVSVIDTTGIVLSRGVLDRMSKGKQSRPLTQPTTQEMSPEVPESTKVTDRKNAIGKPIIPNFKVISEWFDVKWNFETVLAEKATAQLQGLLPEGAFKVAVSSDIGPIENGEIVDVRRLTVSIVVDQNNEQIYLDQDTKQQIFNTVGSAIGYVKGRDKINLSFGDFKLMSGQQNRGGIGRLTENNRSRFFMILALIIGLVALLWRFVRRRKQTAESAPLFTPADSIKSDDFSDLEDAVNRDDYAASLQQFAQTNPDRLAELIMQYHNQDQSTEAASFEPQNPMDIGSEIQPNELDQLNEVDQVFEEDDEMFEDDIFNESPELQEDQTA